MHNDSGDCVDSEGNVVAEPKAANPGASNGQKPQSADSASQQPAADQGAPGAPVKFCGGEGGCVTYPNTAKRYFVDGQTHFDFDIDPNPAPPVADDGKGSLGSGKGLVSVRLLSGAAGALKAALGRVTRGIVSRVSATVSTGLRGMFGRGARRALPAARSVERAARGVAANRIAGQVGENFLARTYGGASQVTRPTSVWTAGDR